MEKEAKTEQKIAISIPAILPAVVVSLVFGRLFGWMLFSAISKPTVGTTTGTQLSGFVALPANDVGSKTVAYLNENLLKSQGVEAKLTQITPYGNALYEVGVDLFKGTEKLQSTSVFVTQDGNLVIFQAPLNLNEKLPEEPAQQQASTLSCNDVSKAESAQLEAFVVSNCPYGLQMQRVLTPIANAGFSANIKVRYLGAIENGKITSMHGDAEAQENLRQICIREEQADKYWAYLAEYIKKGDSNAALKAAGIDTTKLASCTSDATKGLKYAQEDFALAEQYGASGSPYLVLNGVPVSEFAFAADKNISSDNARSADNVKNLICCGFSSEPGTCSTALATDGAATAYSEKYSSGSSTGAASCG